MEEELQENDESVEIENYKIIRFSIIYVKMQENKADTIYSGIEKLLEESFVHSNIENELFERINANTILQLEKIIISLGNYSIANIILIIGDTSERENIIKAINQVSYMEHKIIKMFARLPTLLNPELAERLYSSGQNKKLLFCLTGCEATILETVDAVKNSMILAAYMLHHVFAEFHYFINAYKVAHEEISYKYCGRFSVNSSSSSDSSFHTDSQEDTDESDIEEFESQQISVTKALMLLNRTVRENTNEKKTEKVGVKDAYGRILYRTVFSSCNLPPFSIATKYGYAVLANSGRNQKKVQEAESEEITTTILEPDAYMMVNKRASIPLGAIAVVPIENTIKCDNWEEKKIKITLPSIKYGLNIMPACSDIKKNQLIIDAYKRISPTEIGLLASCGCNEVTVSENLSVGILCIGNELHIPESSTKPQFYYNTNRTILISLLKENGFNYMDFGITYNNWVFLIYTLEYILSQVDLLVTTGSTNNDEWIELILKKIFHATIHFKNVNIKPGKSTTFATCTLRNKTKYILCLPANPASVIIMAHLLVLPFINKIHFNYALPAIVTAQIQQKLLLYSRPRYVWATLSWSEQENFAKATCKEEDFINNKLSNCIGANALLILPTKTAKTQMLEALSFVPAILVKFPTRFYIQNIPD